MRVLLFRIIFQIWLILLGGIVGSVTGYWLNRQKKIWIAIEYSIDIYFL